MRTMKLKYCIVTPLIFAFFSVCVGAFYKLFIEVVSVFSIMQIDGSWKSAIIINVLSSLIFLTLLSGLGFLLFKWRFKTMLAGRYQCSIKTKNNIALWGECSLKFHPINNSYEFTMVHTNGHDKLWGRGSFVRNEYFVGTYGEPKNPLRRRCGAFFLVLDGNGLGFKGKNLAIDPTNDRHMPSVEEIVWKKIDD